MEGETTAATATTTPAAAPTPTPAPAPAPTPAAAATPTPTAPPEANVVKYSLEEHAKLQTRLNELDRRLAEEATRRQEAEKKAMERAIAEGDAKKLMETLAAKTEQEQSRLRSEFESARKTWEETAAAERKRLADEKAAIENALRAKDARTRRFAIDGELGRALAGYNLVDGAADDITALVRGQLSVEEQGESFVVRAGDQPVGDFLRSYLERRPHLVRSSSPRGGVLNGTTSAAIEGREQPAADPNAHQPRNMGEWAVMQAKSAVPGAVEGGHAAQGIRPRPR